MMIMERGRNEKREKQGKKGKQQQPFREGTVLNAKSSVASDVEDAGRQQ